MLAGLALTVLGLLTLTAVVNRQLVRTQPTLFLGVTFLIAGFLPATSSLTVYVRLGAAAVALLLLWIQLTGYSRSLLRQMRLEVILLVSAIAAIFLSQLALQESSTLRGPIVLTAIALGAAFIVTGVSRVTVAMIKALKHKLTAT